MIHAPGSLVLTAYSFCSLTADWASGPTDSLKLLPLREVLIAKSKGPLWASTRLQNLTLLAT